MELVPENHHSNGEEHQYSGAATQSQSVSAMASESCCQSCCESRCECRSCNGCPCCTSEVWDTKIPKGLRKVRTLGIKFLLLNGINGLIFPLLPRVLRDIVVSAELLYTIAGLILSIVNYIKADCHQVFNVVNFAIGLLAMLLSIASTVEALYRRNICRKEKENEKNRFEAFINLLRTALAELLIYPLLICSIFNLVTGRPFASATADDIVGLIRFGLSAISFIVFVYILRLVILAGAIFKIQKVHKANQTGSLFASYFLVYFFIYVILQMVVQIFMIMITGRKIYAENLHFYDDAIQNYTCLPVVVSGYLWYMIAGTYLFPIIGVLMFFVVGYFWVQEFCIGIFFLHLKMIERTPDAKDVFQINLQINEAFHVYNKSQLNNKFDGFKRKCFCTKFSNPFRNPVLLVLCISFLLMNYFFMIFGSNITINNPSIFSILSPYGIFYIVSGSTLWGVVVHLTAIIFGILANFYVFIVGIVGLIILPFSPIIILCCLKKCLENKLP